MSPRVRNKAFLTLLASVVALGGCAGSAANVPVASQSALASLVQPATGKGHGGGGSGGGIIYTAQLYGNDIQIYQPKGSQLQLTGSYNSGVSAPQGSVTTPSGWLYVANSGDQDVLVYRTKKVKSGGNPTTVLEDYGQIPVNVDVIPSRNLVAVSNSGTASVSGSISVYVGRNVVPSRTLTFSIGSDIIDGYGIALDQTGNCYWGTYDLTAGQGNIVEFTGCSGSGSIVVPNVGEAGGLAFDQSGDLFYINRSGSMPAIYACHKLGPCTPYTFNNLYEPINMNFDKHDKALWVADAAGFVDEFSVKPGKLTITEVMQYPLGSSKANLPFGIAPNPGG